MARIVDAIGRVRDKRLSCVEAAELLGLSERHFRRLRDAYLEGGAEAIIDKRRGRAASNKVSAAIGDWVAEQYRTKYFDFTAKHFHEALRKDGFRYSYTWTKSVLYLRGLLKPSKVRGPHRRKRPRSPLPGMLVFQDGSAHDWFLGRRAPCDLIVTLDDATGMMLSAFFVEEEGTASSFKGLRETIEKHGLFSSFYTDRGSHYFHTPQGRREGGQGAAHATAWHYAYSVLRAGGARAHGARVRHAAGKAAAGAAPDWDRRHRGGERLACLKCKSMDLIGQTSLIGGGLSD